MKGYLCPVLPLEG